MRNKESGGMDKTTLWFIAGFVVLAAAVVIYAGVTSGGFAASNSPQSSFVATTAPPIGATDQTLGPANAPVSLLEYGDFECPACDEYEPMVTQLLRDYNGRIRFVFREFPLYTIHPLAGIAAQSAEAAGLQGKFWEMHDLLYASSTWSQWTASAPGNVVGQYFDGYAQSLGLNVAQFDKDINSSQVTDKIQADVASGNSASVDHTPTFFVNLTQIPNPGSYAEFRSAIDAALASSTAAPSAGATSSASAPTAAAPIIPLTVTSTAP